MRLREDDAVAGAHSPLVAEPLARDGAQGGHGDHRPGHRVGDLRVPAHDRRSHRGRGAGHVGEQVQRLRWSRARRQQHGRQQPPRVRSHCGHIVGVDERREVPQVRAGERDGVAVRDQGGVPRDVERHDVFADPGRHEDGGVGGPRRRRQVPGKQVVGELAGGQGQAEPDDSVELGQAVHDEVGRAVVAVAGDRLGRCGRGAGGVRQGRGGGLTGRRRGPAVGEKGGHGAGGPPREHVQHVVPDDEQLRRRHAHGRGGVPHAVRRRLGRGLVVARDHDVEARGVQVREAREGRVHRRPAVAREHPDLEAGVAQPPHELLGAGVGRGLRGAGQLEAFERGERGEALRPCGQRLDPLEHEAVRRATDLALEGGEVEGAGARERAVEVEQHRAQAEGSGGRDGHRGSRVTCASRPRALDPRRR